MGCVLDAGYDCLLLGRRWGYKAAAGIVDTPVGGIAVERGTQGQLIGIRGLLRLRAHALAAVLRLALRRDMARLPDLEVASRAGASQFASDIAVYAVALLVGGAEFACLAGAVLRDTTGARPVVATLGRAFAVRRTARS